MKIILTSWAPFFAGAEVAAERLAVGLREAGHEVTCVVGTEGELLARLQDQKFPCHYVPTRFTDKWRWWSYRSARNRLVRILRDVRPDVIHSNDLPTHQMTSDAARGLGIPRICHHRWIFDGGAIDWFGKFGAERHLFVSRALKDELCGNSRRLAARPGQVVYDGLTLPAAPKEGDRQAARAKLGLSATKRMVLFAGQIIERKGVADLIHAWARLPNTWRERADLVIVGDDLEGRGEYKKKMEALAKEVGIEARFAGFQKNVPTWLAACDVVLVPSHAEPLGNATLEAMAHARAVIGGDVGGIPEMVTAEESGLLVPPRSPERLAAALDRLLSDEPLRERMGQAGRRRCEEKFSLAAHVEAVVAQYSKVLAAQQAEASA